ncbi:MAG TPA: DUF4383 domain-containing protein [Usitatibacter sp.]|nr:DUF4383 domain-containing protein [Usitatibacter sp.]
MKALAFAAGCAFVGLGVAGFVPALSPGDLVLGVFAVDPMQNMFRIATGLLGLALAFSGEVEARTWFRLVGIVYALLMVVGLVTARSGEVLGMSANAADHALHSAVAALALYLGFFARERHDDVGMLR